MTDKLNVNEHLEEFNKHCLNWFQLVMYRDSDFANWLSKTIQFFEDYTTQNYKYKIKHK